MPWRAVRLSTSRTRSCSSGTMSSRSRSRSKVPPPPPRKAVSVERQRSLSSALPVEKAAVANTSTLPVASSRSMAISASKQSMDAPGPLSPGVAGQKSAVEQMALSTSSLVQLSRLRRQNKKEWMKLLNARQRALYWEARNHCKEKAPWRQRC